MGQRLRGTPDDRALAVAAGGLVCDQLEGRSGQGGHAGPRSVLPGRRRQDRSLEAVDAANNTTITNLLVHTFAGNGTVTLGCDNPGAATLFVTNKVITAMPVGAIKASTLP